jgi:membrane-associated HD superfamily phosphohydrolase
MHLIGFIIRIYHYARSFECQIHEENDTIILHDLYSWTAVSVIRISIETTKRIVSVPKFSPVDRAVTLIITVMITRCSFLKFEGLLFEFHLTTNGLYSNLINERGFVNLCSFI